MAVDANVLIFERVREELRLGKTPRAAIEAGYAKAFVTILDSNTTTLIAALFLFGFGTGPVKGFAVTLSVGIVVSMFTAIFVTRIIFDYFVWKRKVQSISI
jgi:preprotein translocase subunit SecD